MKVTTQNMNTQRRTKAKTVIDTGEDHFATASCYTFGDYNTDEERAVPSLTATVDGKRVQIFLELEEIEAMLACAKRPLRAIEERKQRRNA